jgi:S1-C subfamily serine protease
MKHNNFSAVILRTLYISIAAQFMWQSVSAQDREKKIPVKLIDLTFGMPRKASIGRVHSNNYVYDDRAKVVLGEETYYKQALCDGFDLSYLLIKECYWNEPPQFKYIIKEAICIHPVLRKIYFGISKGARGAYEGRTTGTVEWQITKNNSSNDTIAIVSVESVLQYKYYSTKSIIDSLIGESAKKLLEIDSIYKKLVPISEANKKATGESNDTIHLEKIKPLLFKSPKEFSNRITQSVVTVSHEDGFGSGCIISKEGHILTNYHVVEGHDHVKVKLSFGITLDATVLRTNPDYDMALLIMNGSEFAPLSIGNSDSCYIGESVFAVGTPSAMELNQTMTKGIISGRRSFDGHEYFQTDVSINKGNSGGPLIDDDGEVIGMVTSKMIGRGIEGIGFAIPINNVLERLVIDLK